MDIVDTFNHLIPTEHLDDALFLGSSNLESEACDEFSTNQNVVEDSLKNMLSDKDPMLGSASTQFCLPVLDSTDPNFQMSSSTGVGLDDIMDVAVVKEAVSDPNDEEDLILPNKDVNSLDRTSMNLRKSSRLIEQGSTRSLRQSTVETHLNPVQVASPKKSRSSRKDLTEQANDNDNIDLSPKNEEKRSRKTTPLEHASTPLPNSRRSSRIADKELKDKIYTDEKPTQNLITGDSSTPGISIDILSTLQTDADQPETLHGDPVVLQNENSSNATGEVTEPSLSDLQKDDCHTDLGLKNPIEEKTFEQETYPDEKKSDVIYDKVHKELALLSGFVECNLSVNTLVHSNIKSESSLENVDTGTIQNDLEMETNLKALELVGSNMGHSFDADAMVLESDVQKLTETVVDEQESMQSESGSSKPSHSRKGSKKQKSNSMKSLPQSTASTNKNTNFKLKQRKKTSTVNPVKSDVQASAQVTSQEKNKIIKVRKKNPDTTTDETVASKNIPMKKKLLTAEKKGHRSKSLTLMKQQALDDVSKDNQGSSKETRVQPRTRSLSHSSEKPFIKHQSPVSSKVNNEGKETADHKEVLDHLEEKSKLKKSVPPRQRRSSKSISVDEPPLFIPDNIPNIKRDVAELPSPGEKHTWNPIRHCISCRKLHGNRFMVGCGRCDDWFHGECVGLSLPQAQQMEAEDREYICMKCCADEEKMDVDTSAGNADSCQKTDIQQNIQTAESEKTDHPSLIQEKPKQVEDVTKHKVKISKKDMGDGKHPRDRKDLQIKKRTTHPDHKHLPSATSSHRVSEEKREKSSKDPTNVQSPEEKVAKSGFHEKQEMKKKQERKVSSSQNSHSSTPAPKPSVDQIRQSVRHSLKDILLKKLSESSSKIPEERAAKVSTKIEKELFSFYRDTDAKYKNKYRSLMFNLKDPKNNVLFKRVLKGDITPEHLIKMSPEELASRELAAWRQRENRHTIEMIEKEQREVERRPITKITHKGEIEIESDAQMKETESLDVEDTVVKQEKEKEEEVQKEKESSAESTSDTTGQHKNHLFDLNCKICTGRMAPPAEDLSPKKVKVSLESVCKPSDEVDVIVDVLPSTTTTFNLDALETEKQDSPKESYSSAASSDALSNTEKAEDESTFLARLNYVWKGFLNMPSVAKFVIKAYPVSGSLEHLTEDLPDSIQVGGRISPQTVWDYVDKIKASGTKETCLIRFSPVTEEDQISYTLLFSYFSSRKRYGVVANNMRQVKDMYLIPLGASEKIPHLFVPFDGPGLEVHRPNLLLALIIRQRVKRQHSLALDDESAGKLINVPVEKRSKIEITDEDDEDDDENDFFNSFTTVLHKSRNRAQLSDTEEPQTVETVSEAPPPPPPREPPKPLRFLPGVLVGWESPHATFDLANKPLPVDDILQSLLGTTEKTFEHKEFVKKLPSVMLLTKEKMNIEGTTPSVEVSADTFSEVEKTPENNEEVSVKQDSACLSSSGMSLKLSLRGKPPDVSTEAFLSNLNELSSEEGMDSFVLDDLEDTKQESNRATAVVSPQNVTKGSIMDENIASSENVSNRAKSPKSVHIKRDPRQAAVKTHKSSSSDGKNYDSSSSEEKTHKEKDTIDRQSHHKKEKVKKIHYEDNDSPSRKSEKLKGVFSSSTQHAMEDYEKSKSSDIKPSTQDLLIDDTDPLQQFRRALAANKAQASNTSSETSSKNPPSALGGTFSAIRMQQPPFLPLKVNPPAFPFQNTPSFALQGNPMFPYATQIPPLLPTPLGIGFPRPPRFAADTGLHNPLLAWHPALQLARQPPYLGQMAPGPLLGPEQIMYQGPQKFYNRDRGPERRHSDPWDKSDRISERALNRGSRSEYRQRFCSESHHLKEKRQHEKESDKHGDKDSDRSRRRDREKDRSHDRDRKSRDESHRDKERSRSTHSDRSSESKSHKESRSVDKSKNEDRMHDKEKNRDRNKDREEDRERDRHHREREHTDKSKSKR